MDHAVGGASRRGSIEPHVRRRLPFADIRRDVRALLGTTAFILSMAPGRLSRPVHWLTRAPRIERVVIPDVGPVAMDLYRPSTAGPHPGVLVSLGVLPVGVEDPRVAMVGQAFARSGFVALLYWSPAMRDLNLDPEDIPRLVSSYETLLARPDVDPDRSGMFGVCVGASFALIAAAQPGIRHRMAFVAAHAPYSSLRTLALEIAGATKSLAAAHEPWAVDPLTWTAYVRCLTGWLDNAESGALRHAFENRVAWNASKTEIVRSPVRDRPDPASLSADGRAVLRLLEADRDDAERALDGLPARASALLAAMSPISCAAAIDAPVLVLMHDRDDQVIPVAESRRLWAAIGPRPGASYTEMGFNHLRIPSTWSVFRIVREMARGFGAWYPVFRATAR